jgi:hypothetical protein
MVLMVLQEQVDHRDQVVVQDLLEHQELMAPLEQVVLLDLLEQVVLLDLLEQVDHRDRAVLLEQRVRKVIKEVYYINLPAMELLRVIFHLARHPRYLVSIKYTLIIALLMGLKLMLI